MVFSCGTCQSSQTVETEYVTQQFSMAKRAVGKMFGCGENKEPRAIKSLFDEDVGLAVDENSTASTDNEDTNSIEKNTKNLEIVDYQVEMNMSHASVEVKKDDDDVRDGAEKDSDENSVATESTAVLKKSVAKAVAKYVAKITGSKNKKAKKEAKVAADNLSADTHSLFAALSEARSQVLSEAGLPDIDEPEVEEETEEPKENNAEELSNESKKEPVMEETKKEEPVMEESNKEALVEETIEEPVVEETASVVEETNEEPAEEESKDKKERVHTMSKSASFQRSIKSSSSAKGYGKSNPTEAMMAATQPLIQTEEPREEEPEPEAELRVEDRVDKAVPKASFFQELSIKSSASGGDASVTSRLSELVNYRRLVQNGLQSPVSDTSKSDDSEAKPAIFESPSAKE